jgi:hypothetical protein
MDVQGRIERVRRNFALRMPPIYEEVYRISIDDAPISLLRSGLLSVYTHVVGQTLGKHFYHIKIRECIRRCVCFNSAKRY